MVTTQVEGLDVWEGSLCALILSPFYFCLSQLKRLSKVKALLGLPWWSSG